VNELLDPPEQRKLKLSAGIAGGRVLVTRVGLNKQESELSILGDAANNAAKISDEVAVDQAGVQAKFLEHIPEASDTESASFNVGARGQIRSTKTQFRKVEANQQFLS
jgi:class 3 adenylate cyclase